MINLLKYVFAIFMLVFVVGLVLFWGSLFILFGLVYAKLVFSYPYLTLPATILLLMWIKNYKSWEEQQKELKD